MIGDNVRTFSQEYFGAEDYEDEEEYVVQKDNDDIEIKTYKDIEKELGLIRLSWPTVEIEDNFKHLPLSYRSTSEKEKLLLWYAENFRQQYRTIYNDRKPLLLACDNECNVQKFVSTNIRPSTLPYPQLYDWLGCAKFVSDHLAYEPLKRPLAIPEQIRSPTWLLNNQRGNSFEYATLLVSLLIGQGYNALVVSGYASRELTLCDMSMHPCPYLPNLDETSSEFVTRTTSRYQLKAPPDFRSKLLMEIEELERKRMQEENHKREEERQRMIIEQERPRPDKYWGHRVHGWVLVLLNDPSETTRYQEITEPFFIEPTTGYSYAIKDPQTKQFYHGIESVWNNQNYWVNMQICTDACYNINWDLDNPSLWEALLPGEYASSRGVGDEKTDEDSNILLYKHLDMPFSYVQELQISSFDFERHYPNGQKVMFFKKTKVVLFAPYVQMDGLIEKITEFEDYDYTVPLKIHEKYANRGDKLCKSVKDIVNGTVIDSYDRGRPDACKEHKYSSLCSNLVEHERTLKFYDVVRIDGLEEIEITNLYLIQRYVGRKDFLYYRNVEFSMDNNESIIPKNNQYRKIAKITEMFERNNELPANEDIEIREFSMDDNEIQLKYHYNDDAVTRATRTFVKPPIADRGDRLVFHESMTHGYDPDPMAKPGKSLEILYLLEAQLKAEEKSVNSVRDAEKEVSTFLKTRKKEYFIPKLTVSLFDRNRNEDAKAGMLAKEELLQARSVRDMNEDMDYLRPFLARIGNPKTLTESQALELRQECINDFKQILTNRANEIWRKILACRKELEELQSQLAKGEELSKEDKEKLTDRINEVNTEMHTFDIRLKRHCNLASDRYQVMMNSLDEDERLSSLKDLKK